ncbi:MAG: hypothetical protein KJO40_03445 [Deltaproteobacteria bacterium]|nr:hypothetical protein [Deltaproteobacteria bacterium]NND28357.1 hypothetical protein [Myxococcales bacterium]NNK05775.1 hypothetical protein [Myxococcales bacterium]
MRTLAILSGFFLAGALGTACKKSDGSPSTVTPASARAGLNCDHDLESNALAKHSWPYPADHRNLRWGEKYQKMRLKFKPTSAAFVTATVTWKSGELIVVEDSEVRIIKPRRLIAKRDLYVKRKVWDQGIQVEREFLAVAEGQVGSFLFYNSRGMCMVGTEGGPAWTQCTLDDAFEGLSHEEPQACAEVWWVKVRKSKANQGWMPVMPGLMERVPPRSDAAK